MEIINVWKEQLRLKEEVNKRVVGEYIGALVRNSISVIDERFRTYALNQEAIRENFLLQEKILRMNEQLERLQLGWTGLPQQPARSSRPHQARRSSHPQQLTRSESVQDDRAALALTNEVANEVVVRAKKSGSLLERRREQSAHGRTGSTADQGGSAHKYEMEIVDCKTTAGEEQSAVGEAARGSPVKPVALPQSQ